MTTTAATSPTPTPVTKAADERRASIEKIEDEKLEYADPEADVAVLEAGAGETKKKGDYTGFTQKTDPKEIKLVRKLDWYIMPSLWGMYWLNYLDRNAIALAKLSSIEKDLGLSDVQYQTAVSILFVGYVFVGVPSNMLITRLHPGYYLCAVMVTWAVLSICTAFAKNYVGLLMTRFFLGALEAPYYPGALLIISNFYTRTEVATRIAILYTGNILATAFAGIIAAGIFQLDGARGYAGWQWLFIIQGAVTGLVAIMCFPFLPNKPHNTRWLNPEERTLASERLLRDKVDEGPKGTPWQGLKQAVSDYRVWIFIFAYNMHLSANGFKNFMPSVVNTLGFSQIITLVLICPPYLLAGAFTLYISWSSGKHNERTWHITICKIIAIIGFVLAPATLNTGVRYFAMVVFSVGTYGVNSILLGWAATVCSQTQEKKAVVMALMASIGTGSFIYTPYLFRDSDKPRYTIAMSAMAAFSLMTIVATWALRWILKRQNRRLRETDATTLYPY